MDKMFIPNTQKWIQYYQNLGKDGHNPYINNTHRGGKQIGGGSLSGSPRQFITPIGQPNKSDHEEKVTVKLVSPVQQTIDQAKDEVERNKEGIKRKRPNTSVSLDRKRRKKQIKTVKKSPKKQASKKTSAVKRLKKKVPKKTVATKRLNKNRKAPGKQAKKKNTLKKKLKSTFNDIFGK